MGLTKGEEMLKKLFILLSLVVFQTDAKTPFAPVGGSNLDYLATLFTFFQNEQGLSATNILPEGESPLDGKCFLGGDVILDSSIILKYTPTKCIHPGSLFENEGLDKPHCYGGQIAIFGNFSTELLAKDIFDRTETKDGIVYENGLGFGALKIVERQGFNYLIKSYVSASYGIVAGVACYYSI